MVTFRTEHRTGINKHSVTVTSNDKTNPTTHIEVVADLYQLLTVAPTRQWFGQIKQAEEATRQFVFAGSKVNEVEFTNVRLKEDSANPEAYTWTINDVTTDDTRNLTLDITVHGNKITPGRFGDVLIVETNLEPTVTMELYLTGEILGAISANPKRLYFGQYEVDQEMESVLKLTANTDTPFKILSAYIDEAEFKIDPWELDALIEHTLTIRFLPQEARDRLRSFMTIKTDMESQPVVEVEIHAYQRRIVPGKTRERMEAQSLTLPKQASEDVANKAHELTDKLTP